MTEFVKSGIHCIISLFPFLFPSLQIHVPLVPSLLRRTLMPRLLRTVLPRKSHRQISQRHSLRRMEATLAGQLALRGRHDAAVRQRSGFTVLGVLHSSRVSEMAPVESRGRTLFRLHRALHLRHHFQHRQIHSSIGQSLPHPGRLTRRCH